MATTTSNPIVQLPAGCPPVACVDIGGTKVAVSVADTAGMRGRVAEPEVAVADRIGRPGPTPRLPGCAAWAGSRRGRDVAADRRIAGQCREEILGSRYSNDRLPATAARRRFPHTLCAAFPRSAWRPRRGRGVRCRRSSPPPVPSCRCGRTLRSRRGRHGRCARTCPMSLA